MNRKRHSLLEPNFWSKTSVIWGLATGNVIALTLVAGLVAWLSRNALATEWTCVVMFVLTAPITLYTIRESNVASKMRNAAEAIGGFVACALGGFIFPFAILPMLVVAGRQAYKEAQQASRVVGQSHHPTGREVFFSLPGNVAKHAGQELAASFFNEHKS